MKTTSRKKFNAASDTIARRRGGFSPFLLGVITGMTITIIGTIFLSHTSMNQVPSRLGRIANEVVIPKTKEIFVEAQESWKNDFPDLENKIKAVDEKPEFANNTPDLPCPLILLIEDYRARKRAEKASSTEAEKDAVTEKRSHL